VTLCTKPEHRRPKTACEVHRNKAIASNTPAPT
jgi:hypothetical protein